MVALMLLWAVHDGGYDSDTWYWGALLTLGLLAAIVVVLGSRRASPTRAGVVALVLLSLYVAWSYLSISWAQAPGDALQGSNRALLYLLVFALMLALPWRPRGAQLALLTFVLGVGVIAIVLLVRLASDDHVASLVIDGRLAAPTGYFNSTAALFTIGALTAIVLAARRDLPGLLRAVLLAFACAGLQLALVVQSRGWLFTLPVVAIIAIAVVPDRVRIALVATIPIAGALVPVRRLLDVYDGYSGPALDHAAARAGQAALLICGVVFVLGTLVAWGDRLVELPVPSAARRRALAAGVSAVAIAAVCVAVVTATHGHPVRFIDRQWHGFSQPQTAATGSHFTDVGSGRYDFWRVALDAVIAHPIGGLGQDNFADYYVTRRRTSEEPQWTHSLEMRLLAHTGIVGFLLFMGFVIAAIAAALRARRRGTALARHVAAAALLPFVVWLVYGSVDWFWEVPALSGPALGFLGMAGALGRSDALAAAGTAQASRPSALLRLPRPVAIAGATVAQLAAVLVLALPYLSVREVSLATNVRQSNPAAALRDLARAAKLNPLNADPGRLAGAIALQTGENTTAEQRFGQSISREPGGWFSWLGQGLAVSALGDSARAHHDFAVAMAINSQQPAVRQALARVYTRAPMTAAEALKILVIAQ
jgi:Flp pilus assembly protein TadD